MSRAPALGVALILLASTAHAQPRLSFAEAIRRAARQNPDAMVAAEEIRRARAIVEEVRAASFPTLAAIAQLRQLNSPRISAGTNAVTLPQTQFQVAGTAALPFSPQSWVQWAQAREAAKVTQLTAAQVQRNVAIAIGLVYLSLLTQHRIVEASELAVSDASAHVDYTRTRLDAGNGTLLDHERAAALLASDRTQLENARFLVTRLQEQLGILVGENGPIDVTPALTLPPLPLDATIALDDAMRLRPDLRVSRELLTLARRVLRESWADYVPGGNLTFSLFYETPATPTYPMTGYELFVNLGFTVYDGGLRYGLLKERRALEREAYIRLDAELRLVRADVRTAATELARTTAALVSARESARLWADSLRLALVSYRSGLTTNIDVIDAETASLNANVQAAVAENNEQQARLDLLLASGRFP